MNTWWSSSIHRHFGGIKEMRHQRWQVDEDTNRSGASSISHRANISRPRWNCKSFSGKEALICVPIRRTICYSSSFSLWKEKENCPITVWRMAKASHLPPFLLFALSSFVFLLHESNIARDGFLLPPGFCFLYWGGRRDRLSRRKICQKKKSSPN